MIPAYGLVASGLLIAGGIMVLYAALLLLSVIFDRNQSIRRVQKHLARQGATLLTFTVVEEPGLSDRDNHTSLFQITYRDRNGWVHHAQCITAFGDGVFFSNDTVLPADGSTPG